MPMRPKKSVAALTSTVPRLDNQPWNARSGDQPQPPSSAPSLAVSNPVPRRVNTSQSHVSLVVRNSRASRNTAFYKSIPRYNHYLLARSLVEQDCPPKPLAPKQNSRENHHKIPPSPLRRDIPPLDSVISDFIWRFSAPCLDPKTLDVFATLKSCDPETFKELMAGLE